MDLGQLRDVVARAVHLSQISRTPAMYDENGPPQVESDQLVGNSPPMQELYKSIGRIAPQDVTVLILGESGTGKEMVARAIYQHSRRSRAPFLAINCAAIPEPLLESELFGHERGAFTGADRRRIGKFEQADGGTIFMDEVGDMAPATQAKLLRLLQEEQFERVGGNATIHTDIRLIAATNQDLESLAAAGRFRQDLFYRLNVLTIRIPPLRERIDDIPLLVNYFLGRMNREFDRHVHGAVARGHADSQAAQLAGQRPRIAKRRQARLDPYARRYRVARGLSGPLARGPRRPARRRQCRAAIWKSAA